jgi:spore maturation protein CgeB
MPLRPFEICCSGGLLFTQYNRELPDMFEIGRECVAFRTNEEMLTQMDRIVKSPAEFDAVVAAGRNRTLKDHTWDKRVQTIVAAACDHFALAW